jgi:hypothetical protein
MNDLKRQYILADHCDGCGLCPLLRNHECNTETREAKERCPACGKLLAHFRAGELLIRAERCKCDTAREEVGTCPFCPECCKLLEASVLAHFV